MRLFVKKVFLIEILHTSFIMFWSIVVVIGKLLWNFSILCKIREKTNKVGITMNNIFYGIFISLLIPLQVIQILYFASVLELIGFSSEVESFFDVTVKGININKILRIV